MSDEQTKFKSPVDGYALDVFNAAFRGFSEGNITPLKYRSEAVGTSTLYLYIAHLTRYDGDGSTDKVMVTILVSADGNISKPQINLME